MGDATVTFGRGESRTAFEGTFGAESRQKIRRQGAPQDEGHGEEHQQRKNREQKNKEAEYGE